MSSTLQNQISKPEDDDPDWQSQKHTPADRAKHMLELGLYSDVEFTVGDEHQVNSISFSNFLQLIYVFYSRF